MTISKTVEDKQHLQRDRYTPFLLLKVGLSLLRRVGLLERRLASVKLSRSLGFRIMVVLILK